MRNLTDEEQAELRWRCIFCKQAVFFKGPVGGLSINVYCTGCLTGYNITHEQLPWQLIGKPDAWLARTLSETVKIEDLVAGINKAVADAVEQAFKARRTH